MVLDRKEELAKITEKPDPSKNLAVMV